MNVELLLLLIFIIVIYTLKLQNEYDDAGFAQIWCLLLSRHWQFILLT